MPKIVPQSPRTRFRSLPELLEEITHLPFDDAYPVANDEYKRSCGRMDWVREVHKVKAVRVDPDAVDYFEDLKLLLPAMEGKGISPIRSEHSRRLVEAALKKWARQ